VRTDFSEPGAPSNRSCWPRSTAAFLGRRRRTGAKCYGEQVHERTSRRRIGRVRVTSGRMSIFLIRVGEPCRTVPSSSHGRRTSPEEDGRAIRARASPRSYTSKVRACDDICKIGRQLSAMMPRRRACRIKSRHQHTWRAGRRRLGNRYQRLILILHATALSR
jgi:hypothetical protein